MDEDALWQTIKSADDKNYVMTAGCSDSYYGLIDGHAYSVLGVSETEDGRMIQVRNPWAEEYYYGPGKDQDNDGIFYVAVDIFKDAFSDFTILYYDDWQKTNLGSYYTK